MTELSTVPIPSREEAAAIHWHQHKLGMLPMWVVTRRPKDLPSYEYVARLGCTKGGGISWGGFVAGETLAAVRAQLPIGLIRIIRQPCDDPGIVERWI